MLVDDIGGLTAGVLSGSLAGGRTAAGSSFFPGTGGTTTDLLEETTTAGSSSLSYSDGQPYGQYHYVWKTDKAWAGTCRRLELKLVDGTTHSALFKFTK